MRAGVSAVGCMPLLGGGRVGRNNHRLPGPYVFTRLAFRRYVTIPERIEASASITNKPLKRYIATPDESRSCAKTMRLKISSPARYLLRKPSKCSALLRLETSRRVSPSSEREFCHSGLSYNLGNQILSSGSTGCFAIAGKNCL